jgi:phenylacetate-CoA ligase
VQPAVQSATLVARVLLLRRRLRARERWTPEQVAAHQARAVAALRGHALARSPFYRRLHAGLEDALLAALPPVSKAALMDAFDEAVTDRALRLVDLQAYLEAERSDGSLFAGRYWVSATSGSSGRRSVIPTDAGEWAAVIASYARANEWAGVRAGLRHRTRMAVVSSTTAWHQSSRVAASVRSRWSTAPGWTPLHRCPRRWRGSTSCSRRCSSATRRWSGRWPRSSWPGAWRSRRGR